MLTKSAYLEVGMMSEWFPVYTSKATAEAANGVVLEETRAILNRIWRTYRYSISS